MRHYSLKVEKVVSSGVVSIAAGDELPLLREGGAAKFDDGTGVKTYACCNPDPVVGKRYRVSLRWDRTRGEYRYLTDPFGALGEVPLVQLPEFGTLPYVPDSAPFQAPASMCPNAPEPGSFSSVGDTVRWTTRIPSDPKEKSTRWKQNQSFATWDGNFAAPSLMMDTSVNRACGGYYDYDYLIQRGVRSWYRGHSIGNHHGVMLPGTDPFNSIAYGDCNAGEDAGGINCVAVQGESQDDGTVQIHFLEEHPAWGPDVKALARRWTLNLDDATWEPEVSADWFGLEMLAQVDILFRNFGDYAWDECLDGPTGDAGEGLENTAAHEFGHFMGLGHNDCPFELMFGRTLVDGITDADWARMKILYPDVNWGCEFPENIYVDENALPPGACGL